MSGQQAAAAGVNGIRRAQLVNSVSVKSRDGVKPGAQVRLTERRSARGCLPTRRERWPKEKSFGY